MTNTISNRPFNQEEILVAREREKREAIKNEFQKQKDLLSHRWGK